MLWMDVGHYFRTMLWTYSSPSVTSMSSLLDTGDDLRPHRNDNVPGTWTSTGIRLLIQILSPVLGRFYNEIPETPIW